MSVVLHAKRFSASRLLFMRASSMRAMLARRKGKRRARYLPFALAGEARRGTPFYLEVAETRLDA